MTFSAHSDLDEDEQETLQASDEEVLREEEDRERLLTTSKSGINRLFRDHDPNAPKPIALSRKDLRKVRRKERRATRRRQKGEDETTLMFEMESGDKDDDDSSSTSSTELFIQKYDTRWTRRRKLFQFIVVPIALISLLGLLILGAYKMSGKSPERPKGTKTLRSNGTSNFAPTTILISIDGFRADYKDRGLTPALNSFIAKGVAPKYMLPSFPSVTFPNHITLVTGLYPGEHGIVGNTFFDPAFKEDFQYTNPEIAHQLKWWPSKVLWSTCEDQGVNSAVLMWPGVEAGIQPVPTILDKYNGTETLSRKVDRVLGLLDRPSNYDSTMIARSEARPEFIALYVPQVDIQGHLHGPNSSEIRSTISKVDSMLGDILNGLKERNLTDVVNVIVVSDHGMATTSNDRLIQLEDIIDVDDIEHMDGWPLYGLRPFQGVDVLSLYERLLSAASEHQHFKVYLRENMPSRWHFSDLVAGAPRIAPLWVVPDAGWAVVHKKDFDVEAAKKDGIIYHPRGLHGYDHESPLMRAIFVARGPAFPLVGNSQTPVFQNTEVYNIVCDSLGITPLPNNGTLRLPLKTIGLHSDLPTEDIPIDLPSSSGGMSMTPTVSASPTSTSSAKPQATSGGEEPNEEEQQKQHHGGGIWDYIIGKIDQAKKWWANFHGFKANGGNGEQ